MTFRSAVGALAGAALLATFGAPLAYVAGWVELATMQRVLLAATVVWFGVAPFRSRVPRAVAGDAVGDRPPSPTAR